MMTPISIASPHPAYLIFAQYDAPAACWMFRVFGPQAGQCGSFGSPTLAFAFVRECADGAPATPAVAAPMR